jgi:di/tripeptidase
MENKKKVDLFEILKKLINIPSFSGEEKKLSDFLCSEYGEKRKLVCKRDSLHNIYIKRATDDEKEKLPLLMAHLDNHSNGDSIENRKRLQEEDFLNLSGGQIIKKYEIQAGFDDKAGLASILYLFTQTDLKFRALFVVQEERSSVGSSFDRQGGGGIDYTLNKWPEIFEKAEFLISLDRQNGKDIINKYGRKGDRSDDRPLIQLCSSDFLDWIIERSEEAGHKMSCAEGTIADVYNVKRKFNDLNCVNLSTGVYGDHSPDDNMKIDETLAVIGVVEMCLKKGGRKK